MKSKCLLLLLVIGVLFGCNPKDVSTPIPIVITYELVSSNTTAQFDITYNGANGPKTATASAGWSQRVNVQQKPFAANVVATINASTAFPFTVRIRYNGAPRKENTGTTVPGSLTTLSVSETFN